MNAIGWESRPRIGVGSRSGSNEAVLTGRKRAASYEIDRQYHPQPYRSQKGLDRSPSRA
jgi:hypothetical protein